MTTNIRQFTGQMGQQKQLVGAAQQQFLRGLTGRLHRGIVLDAPVRTSNLRNSVTIGVGGEPTSYPRQIRQRARGVQGPELPQVPASAVIAREASTIRRITHRTTRIVIGTNVEYAPIIEAGRRLAPINVIGPSRSTRLRFSGSKRAPNGFFRINVQRLRGTVQSVAGLNLRVGAP